QPSPINDDHFLSDHVMVPLTKQPSKRFMVNGRKPKALSDSSDGEEEEDEEEEDTDPLANIELEPFDYYQQLPTIPNETAEFKQLRGMI
ncbi:hypothetical protein, partial [Salmonella enterica]|uniref:hypothetical protein n=1 Tax=Salmonella enterica TaxID=28901 RepID=UPI0020C334A2